jgi:beta-lactamase class A
LPSWLPAGTKVAHKTGTGVRNQNDAGIIYFGDQPGFILTVYTEHLPPELPNGLPGHTAAVQLIGRLSRTCYDALNAASGI